MVAVNTRTSVHALDWYAVITLWVQKNLIITNVNPIKCLLVDNYHYNYDCCIKYLLVDNYDYNYDCCSFYLKGNVLAAIITGQHHKC